MELEPRRIRCTLIGAGDVWPLKGNANWHRRPHVQALPLLSIVIIYFASGGKDGNIMP